MVWLLVKYILSAALRDKLFIGLLLFVAVTISLSVFLGASSITETDRFSLVFTASGLRVGGMLMLVLFIITYLRRAFENADVEYLLSRPMSRLQFLTAHFVSFSMLACVIAGLLILPLLLLSSGLSFDGLLLWGGSILVEFVVMANIALFFGMVLSSAVTATAICMAFYVLARLIGDILGIIASGDHETVSIVMEKIMTLISVFVPRLDLMGQTSWLVYGPSDSVVGWSFILLQGCVFCGLLFAASLMDLNRRQF